MMVSSLFLIATFSVEAETITDGTGDVSSINTIGDAVLITYSPEIDVDNLDLIQATYTQHEKQATVSLQVVGNIENRGKIFDPNSADMNINAVGYTFQLITSQETYVVEYANETCQLSYSEVLQNLTTSDFSVVEGTLTVSFTLASAEETYTSLDVSSALTKINFSAFEDPSSEPDLENAFILLSDVAPNPPLMIYDAYTSNIGSIGENIQFNGSLVPLTGEPPYTYHWDFGDQSSLTQQNPTHTYTKAGVYTYNFTVTDNGGATASQSGTITISAEGGTNNSLSTQMVLFLAILLIVIVIGVVVIVWIIRR
jgi:PKD repeat protein